MNKLVLTTYRKLMNGARKVDNDHALRAMLAATPTALYDHMEMRWRELGNDSSKPESRQIIERVVRKLNGDGDWYHPERGTVSQSTEGEEHGNPMTPVQNYVRSQYRASALSAGSLDTAFAGLKALNGVLSWQDRIPKEPGYAGVDFGFQTVSASNYKDVNDALHDPDRSQVLMDAVRRRRMSLLVAHPMLPGFFQHAIILVTKMERDGAVGVILNKPLTTDDGLCVPVWSVVPDNFHKIFTTHLASNPVMLGGPVASPMSRQQALYVIHTVPGITGASTIAPGLYVSGVLDELAEKIEKGEASAKEMMVMMGYSGWGVEQLQGEICSGSWTILTKRAHDPTSTIELKEPEKSAAPAAQPEPEGEDVKKSATTAAEGEEQQQTPLPPSTPTTEEELVAREQEAIRDERESSKEGDSDFFQGDDTEEVKVRLENHLSIAAKKVDPAAVDECKTFALSTHNSCLEYETKLNEEIDVGEPHQRPISEVKVPHPKKAWVELLGGLSPEYKSMTRLADLTEAGEPPEDDDM